MIVIKRSEFDLSISLEEFRSLFKGSINTGKRVRRNWIFPDFDELMFKQKYHFNGRLDGDKFVIQEHQRFDAGSLHQIIWEGHLYDKKGKVHIKMKAGISISFFVVVISLFLLVSSFHLVLAFSVLSSILFYFVPLIWLIGRFPSRLRKSEQKIIEVLSSL